MQMENNSIWMQKKRQKKNYMKLRKIVWNLANCSRIANLFEGGKRRQEKKKSQNKFKANQSGVVALSAFSLSQAQSFG